MNSYSSQQRDACTSILVTRGASADASTMITYSADAPFKPHLRILPGGLHSPGEIANVIGWENDDIQAQIPQVSRTAHVVGLMNDQQVSVAETTTGGRPELADPSGKLPYDGLLLLALQRSKTARDLIQVVHELVHQHGYRSTAETFSIADKYEVWIMELIGKGPGNMGAVWVAGRVPDGYMTAHANMSRITVFPLDDPDNWLYSPDVVTFAISKGYYDPKSGDPFSFRAAYHLPIDAARKRISAGRVWSIYRRAAPTCGFSDGYFRGKDEESEYPLFIKPDHPLKNTDVIRLMRDHYEGTDFDMTVGVDAGPFNSPYRYRELAWEVAGKKYMWERPVSTQQAGFVSVTQSRAELPDAIGGVTWYACGDAFTSCFVPLYCSLLRLPRAYTNGRYDEFCWESAWWVAKLVSNVCYDRWSRLFPDVRKVQEEVEERLMRLQPFIEKTALKIHEEDESLLCEFLTTYSTSEAERLYQRWKELAHEMFARHVDGYINGTRPF